MCEVTAEGDALVFSAPELELAMAYLAVRTLAERVEFSGGSLRVSPALPEVESSLKSLCNADVSTVLLDLKESLLHLGWLVEGTRDISRIRRSWRVGTAGFLTVEYDKGARTLSVATTQICMAEVLQRMGFKVAASRYLVEAARQVSSLAEALDLGEALSQASC
ncbi:hypothetical protein [Pyrobaculum neutrophilum]|uniref:Uncharacterized protein n=1 Tax=Pyrobaculum neutrophilum (strain DSM 2338 / JCM 9278 / NBRC 100436 / V24Sta) TaxID=444157 RepID=B1YC00_PYRNV|nr:hypothetical protein [Pyrobaculum neutrophilum]ACB40854.1 conserved hypothetical protein [Pyrobaculum neutrophilum V24Sta]